MLALYLTLSVLLTGAPHLAEADKTDPAIKDFSERVERYWDLHKKADESAPPLNKKKDDPTSILEHERGLSATIRAARRNAAEGDVFTAAVQKIIVATIQSDLKTGKGAKAREMILGEGN